MKAWELTVLLPDFGVSKISKAQADLLPNKTVAIPGEDGYIAGLSVFHQLHCLVSCTSQVSV